MKKILSIALIFVILPTIAYSNDSLNLNYKYGRTSYDIKILLDSTTLKNDSVFINNKDLINFVSESLLKSLKKDKKIKNDFNFIIEYNQTNFILINPEKHNNILFNSISKWNYNGNNSLCLQIELKYDKKTEEMVDSESGNFGVIAGIIGMTMCVITLIILNK